MTYAKKRSEGITPDEVYRNIRKRVTEEALTTGERWIVTIRGIPDRKVTTEFAKEIIKWLDDNTTKAQINLVRFTNILSGEDISVEEMRKKG